MGGSEAAFEARPDDAAVVPVQIGRPARSPVDVVARCHLGLPVVIAVPPHLDDGTPFPTHYWLTCPLAVRRIGRIEGAGGVRAADDRIAADPEFAARFRDAMATYAAARDALVDPALPNPPTGGVGGSRGGVKCLHAHYAHHAASEGAASEGAASEGAASEGAASEGAAGEGAARGENPVGADVATQIEPLNCDVPCVVRTPNGADRNPDWSEPKLP